MARLMNPLLDAVTGLARSLGERLAPPLQQRLVLLANHVVSREPAAVQRLLPHAGRRLRIEVVGLPAWLPAWPTLALAVTRAGLFELDENTSADAPADLTLRVAAPEPAQWAVVASGQHEPAVQIDGDAGLAADMQWLVDHLRWDVEADLAEAIGPAAAHQIASIARGVAKALRGMVFPGAGSR
jgi:ubiquinone biosynthesis accessory factor UbiJ